MCGINGIIDVKKVLNLNEYLTSMNSCLRHRGPDSQNVWIDNSLGIGFGHTRLSIIDTSSAGNQPMNSNNNRYKITYNGEIYNFKYLKNQILKQSPTHSFKGHSDTEVLLEYISLFGVENTLKVVNGMFAIALWDNFNKELFLIRDRLGKKPLYFGWINNCFIFSSELKSITKNELGKLKISNDALQYFFKYKYVPSPLSIYQGIYKIPSSSYLKINYNDIHIERDINYLNNNFHVYWKTPLENTNKNQSVYEYNKTKYQIKDLLIKSVSDRMVSDVPIGAFLSSGIDSTLVVSIMNELSEKKIKTYTIGFEDSDFDETNAVKKISKHLGLESTYHYISKNDLKYVIPILSQIYDEPHADSSQIPTVLLSKLASKDVSVVLTGDGGDELMGGYTRHKHANRLNSLNKKLPHFIKNYLKNNIYKYEYRIQIIYDHFIKFFPEMYIYRQFGNKIVKSGSVLGSECIEDFYNNLISNKLDTNKLLNNKSSHDCNLYLEPMPERSSTFRKIMYWDLKNYLVDDVLVKVDRATMSQSIEARSPLLDFGLFNYTCSIPDHFLIKNKTGGKRILNDILLDYIPEDILNSTKSGFRVPLGNWILTTLNEWVEDTIFSSSGAYDYISKDYVYEIYELHKSKKANFEDEIWCILIFINWYDQHHKYMQ